MMQRLVAVGLLVLLMGVPARADAADDLIFITKKLWERDVSALNDYLTDERVKSLAGEVEVSSAVCDLTARFIRSMTMRSSDTHPVERFTKTVWTLAETTLENAKDQPEGHLAMASAYLVRARFNHAAGLDPKVEDWLKASDHCLEAAKFADEKEKVGNLQRAVWYIREGAYCPSVDIDGLYDRAIKICDAHSPATEEPTLAVERGETRLRKALLMVSDRKRKKETVAMAKLAMKEFAGLERNKKVGKRATGLRNQARSFMLENKFGKPDFAMRTKTVGKRRFEIAIPEGSHWEYQGGDGSDHIFTLSRETVDGNFVSIRLNAYSWNVLYTSSQGEVGGDNLKGLMQDDQKTDLDKMEKVERHKKLVKGRLNRAVSKTTGYELRGLDQDGDNWYVRAYLFKLSDWSSSYSLHVSVWGPNPRIDPEIKEVLKGFKPIPKK